MWSTFTYELLVDEIASSWTVPRPSSADQLDFLLENPHLAKLVRTVKLTQSACEFQEDEDWEEWWEHLYPGQPPPVRKPPSPGSDSGDDDDNGDSEFERYEGWSEWAVDPIDELSAVPDVWLRRVLERLPSVTAVDAEDVEFDDLSALATTGWLEPLTSLVVDEAPTDFSHLPLLQHLTAFPDWLQLERFQPSSHPPPAFSTLSLHKEYLSSKITPDLVQPLDSWITSSSSHTLVSATLPYPLNPLNRPSPAAASPLSPL
ncbi:hypothetical protein JCM8547_000145 [Rhodosporidiobolus lusitaniae]